MIEIDKRRPWNPSKNLLLIGPGGAGKSSLGVRLAPLLQRALIDLDEAFLDRVGHIGRYIREEGHESYKLRNSALAKEVVGGAAAPILLVASSGFLTPDNPAPALEANLRLLAESYSVCVLPSRDLEQSVEVVVERQLTRPFARERTIEDETIRSRYPLYSTMADLSVFSTAPPDELARTLAGYMVR